MQNFHFILFYSHLMSARDKFSLNWQQDKKLIKKLFPLPCQSGSIVAIITLDKRTFQACHKSS